MPTSLTLARISCILTAGCLLHFPGSEAGLNPTFRPGTLPLDQDGNQVHAHGGGVLQYQGRFWWYGTSVKLPPSWLSAGMNLYSSQDLDSWAFEGEIFNGASVQGMPCGPPYRLERPKILFSEAAQRWVMLWHLDTPAFGYPAVGVAEANNLTGPYSFVRVFKPDQRDSYDMGVYQDDKGEAYLLRSVENAFLGISRLTPGLNDTQGLCSIAAQAEAPAMFSPAPGALFFVGSHLTGWAANSAMLFRGAGDSPCDVRRWFISQPCRGPGAETTFQSQATFVFPYQYEDGRVLWIYMGDRWAFPLVDQASYVWLPLLPAEDGSFTMRYFERWSPQDVQHLVPLQHPPLQLPSL